MPPVVTNGSVGARVTRVTSVVDVVVVGSVDVGGVAVVAVVDVGAAVVVEVVGSASSPEQDTARIARTVTKIIDRTRIC